ncbi:MAG: hypothetical protein ACP5NO_08550, partial [Thermoplasmata archaeon]
LEWDGVYLSDDYPNILREIGKAGGLPTFIYMQNKGISRDVGQIIEEINLLYVAVTRARESADPKDVEDGDTLFSGNMRKIIEKTEQNTISPPDAHKGSKQG